MMEDFNVQSLLNEAETYRSQGLLEESKARYVSALQLIDTGPSSDDQKEMINRVHKEIGEIEQDISEFEQIEATPNLSHDVQNLIREIFAFSETEEMAEVEGVLALAKFGQHEQALVEFHRLLGKGFAPVVVAKHILECHLALSSPDAAIAQFEQWSFRGLLGHEDLAEVRNFLDDMLEARGLKNKFPKPDLKLNKKKKVNGEKKIALDVYLVKIQLDNASIDLKEVGLDVSFQTKDTISVVVPANQRKLLDYLKLGMTLPKMKFYTTAAVFNGKGVISGKTMIKIGPKQGDYVLDIKIQDV